MATTIWKFPLEIVDEQTIEMPAGSKILCVDTQGRDQIAEGGGMAGAAAFMWAVVDPKAKKNPLKVFIHGTGNPFEDLHRKEYIGTFQQHGGALVWHVFIGFSQ